MRNSPDRESKLTAKVSVIGTLDNEVSHRCVKNTEFKFPKEQVLDIRLENMKWTREPKEYKIESDRIEITTIPNTDLWQQTYYPLTFPKNTP